MQVFDTFCSGVCFVCGKFGAFLWIPECIRCCIPCVREPHELPHMSEWDAKVAFGLTPNTLSKFPIVKYLTRTLYPIPEDV
ncbi:hypothetical protein M422DRAFT_33978 [Sphaerobolus stellatus SS14]|uniref:Unplaced genomic scaffold SPHSTscaffold_98, whole genome shotgun sequence n=1 Tax=Sphaerobolus stellatus (strain SS14) TaxID=990650 RepID=A0A0C9V5V1_SPHS4|nr:hypothetical protein M422DRAFT_33978 [Sphaerobolus stellatus SS14]